jgi:hypothetical protein
MDMQFTARDRASFRTLYYLGMATMAAAHKDLANWGQIGNIIIQAEGEACSGHFTDGCQHIRNWIPKYQGSRTKIIAQSDVLALRQRVLLVDEVNPGRTWRDAGLWLGHSGGAASVAKYARKNTWDATIREGLRRAISHFQELARYTQLKAKATDLANRVETVAHLADPTPPKYADLIHQIQNLVMSV